MHFHFNRVHFLTHIACIAPLGMESETISDAQISASSQLDDNHSARQARLHFKISGIKRGGWSALTNDLNQWLQVDLGSYSKVTRVATQGRNAYNEWVTRYRLQYSDDGITFYFYKEGDNSSAKVLLLLDQNPKANSRNWSKRHLTSNWLPHVALV